VSWSSYTENAAHDVFSGALVAARLNDAALKTRVVNAVNAAVAQTPGGSDPAKYVTRTLPELVMAASLVGYRTAAFESRLRQIMAISFGSPDPGTIGFRNREGPGNGGAMSGATVAAVGVYLNDAAMIAQAIDGLRMFTGSYPGDYDLRGGTWNASTSQSQWTPVNPANSPVRNGLDLSGLMASEMERGQGAPSASPAYTSYPKITIQGRVTQAVILFEAGEIGPEHWSVLVRAAQALMRLPSGYAESDAAQNRLLNWYASAGLAETAPSVGRTTWGTDWTHP
jgi:hypothetical protein